MFLGSTEDVGDFLGGFASGDYFRVGDALARLKSKELVSFLEYNFE